MSLSDDVRRVFAETEDEYQAARQKQKKQREKRIADSREKAKKAIQALPNNIREARRQGEFYLIVYKFTDFEYAGALDAGKQENLLYGAKDFADALSEGGFHVVTHKNSLSPGGEIRIHW